MRMPILTLCFLLITSSLYAEEKNKLLVQLETSRAAIETLSAKSADNKEVTNDLNQARTYIQKAQETANKGKAFIVFGELKPEAELEIRNYLEMGDVLVLTATARLEKARAAVELESLDKQFAAVKAKVKLFEDRKTEAEKMKTELAKCATAAKELELAKAEKALLSAQIEQFAAERSKHEKLKLELADITRKYDEIKSENYRLAAQLEKLLKESKAMATDAEESRKAASKKEQAEAPLQTVPPKQEQGAPPRAEAPKPDQEKPATK